MFARANVLPLALLFFFNTCLGLLLDVNSQDSIKGVAQTLAGSIVQIYNKELKNAGAVGVFPDPLYFWESGSLWNALIGYSHLTGDKKYDETISQALQAQTGDFDAYMPTNQTATLGNDDQSTWGLAALTAAEVGFSKPKNAEWVDYAVNVWNTQVMRLEAEPKNSTCGGGLRWQIFSFNRGYEYKNSWTNGNFFLLSARLAKFTGNATYAQYADRIFKWSQDNKLVESGFVVNDGLSTHSNCGAPNRVRWSLAHGIYTEGAAIMYNMTGAQNWTDAVKGFVNSSSQFQPNKDSILVEEACEKNGKCDSDQIAFKGVFARSFARAALAAPMVADSINKILSTNAKAAADTCRDNGTSGLSCSFTWTTSGSKGKQPTPGVGEIHNVLELVQSLLYPSAKALKSANNNGTSTQNGGAPNTSGTPPPTGAAGSVSVSTMAVLLFAFAAALYV